MSRLHEPSTNRDTQTSTHSYQVLIWACTSCVTVGVFVTRRLGYKFTTIKIAVAQQLCYIIVLFPKLSVAVAGTAAFPPLPNPTQINIIPTPLLNPCPGLRSTWYYPVVVRRV